MFGSLALAFGCSKEERRAVEKAEASPNPAPRPITVSKEIADAVEKVEAVEEKPKPRAPVTEDDFEVLDVVLMDLLDSKDFEPWTRGDDASNKIILDPMTAGYFDRGEHHQFDAEAKGGIEQAERVELGDDLEKRNPEKLISLAGYKPPSPKILVENLIAPSPGEKKPEEGAIDYRFRVWSLPRGSHFVIAWLPGYSKDGNTAVFRAWFGPTLHGATLTYKLSKKDGKWTVAWRYANVHK
jgi:hypothetical protein